MKCKRYSFVGRCPLMQCALNDGVTSGSGFSGSSRSRTAGVIYLRTGSVLLHCDNVRR